MALTKNVVHFVTYESDDPSRCVTMRDLLTKCLTMDPDSICVAEMKNEEAWEAQEAARTGHTVLTTTHASGVKGVYPRLATLCILRTSFPTINGLRHGSTITLFLEFTCLSEVKFEDLDIGSSVDLENLTVGYSHDGYYSDTYDKGLWRHHLNRDECIPHVGIKTYFMSGEAAAPDPPQGTHYYGGPSAKDIGVVANPRLWFKAFRTGMSDELFETIKAVEPD